MFVFVFVVTIVDEKNDISSRTATFKGEINRGRITGVRKIVEKVLSVGEIVKR